MIHVLQIGFGPLGIQTAKFIAEKTEVKTIGVVDINTKLMGKSLNEIDTNLSKGVFVFNSLAAAIKNIDTKPDVAIITTVSSLEQLIPQIKEVANHNIPVISTCEELSYPWELQPELSTQLDTLCKKQGQD